MILLKTVIPKRKGAGRGIKIGNDSLIINEKVVDEFRGYLIMQKQSPHTIRNKLQYVKRFYHILETEDAKDLLCVSSETRQHAMKSLASFSKYLGIYEKWHVIVKRYQLKWPKKEGYEVFNEIFNNTTTSYPSMLEWVKTSIVKLPDNLRNTILFNTLTGLRPDEGYKAIKLIKTDSANYIDKERMLLMHYKYPKNFLRISKKAYVSIINEDILKIAENSELVLSYHLIRKKFVSHSISMNMYYCRKIFATFLRNKGIESEIIDLLQGRIGSSVFVNHYYRPDIHEIITKRIRPVLDELMSELVT